MVLSVSLLAGCADAEPAPAETHGLTVMTAALGRCAANENRDRQFPSGSDRVVIELSGGGVPAGDPIEFVAPRGAESASGAVVVDSVPPGVGMTVRVVGCSGADTLWAGQTHGVEVTEHTKSFPPVFLTPTQNIACTGNAESAPGATVPTEARGFAAFVGDGEQAWLFGGIAGYDRATATATATATVDHYTRLSSEFADLGGLQHARAMAAAVWRSDGKIMVVGGTKRLRFAQPGKPAIWVNSDDAPPAAAEIYDPATGQSEIAVAAPLPAMPALAVMGDGTVLAVGGVEAGGVGDPAEGVRSDTIATVGESGAANGRVLGGARYGATVVPISPNEGLVWGGNESAAVADLGVLVRTDQPLDSGQTPLVVTGAAEVPIFAAGHLLDGDGIPRVLVAGGGVIQPGPAFPRDVAAPRLQIVTIDVGAASANVVDVDIPDLERAFTRAAGSLYGLGDREFLWIGGYTAFQNSAICGGGSDCLQGAAVRFSVDTSGVPLATELAPRLELTVGPFGSLAGDLGDGSWLIVGGIETITQQALDAGSALLRYRGFDRDLCADNPLPVAE